MVRDKLKTKAKTGVLGPAYEKEISGFIFIELIFSVLLTPIPHTY